VRIVNFSEGGGVDGLTKCLTKQQQEADERAQHAKSHHALSEIPAEGQVPSKRLVAVARVEGQLTHPKRRQGEDDEHRDAPITIKTHLKDANFVETTVEDHGIGIPDGLVGHVFDKFYRSHRSSKAVGGTGLGLYIAKTIVDAHGGQIWVKTREGQGTTFGFTIPTYESVAHEIQSSDNGAIERSAHGWIKNHTLYRG
jgi:light-regulated signal transduction histidine kinase (bacteriophytochrome)